MFSHQNRGHKKTKMSSAKIRRGKEPGELAKPFAKKIKQMMGYV